MASKEFKTKIEEKKLLLQKATKDWSEDDIQEHMASVAEVYRSNRVANKLGNFDWDPNNVYYWSTDDGNVEKLFNRQKVGWGFATAEDARRSGLTDERMTESRAEGETCVEMSHKNCKAVLLKIPRELFEMNEKVKERIRQNRPVLDAEGGKVSVNVSEDAQRVTKRRAESIIQIK